LPNNVTQIDARAAERFWSRVDKSGPVPVHVPELGPCWFWGDSRVRGVKISWNGEPERVAKIALVMSGVTVPDGALLLHHCDVGACISPRHIYPGTHAQNMRDKVKRNRTGLAHSDTSQNEKSPFGGALSQARLAAGLTQQQLAYAIDVHPLTLARWEAWTRPSIPNIHTLARLCDRLNVGMAALLDGRVDYRNGEIA
jgi:DNA-binding XRE family transcriptional regulator